MSRGRRSLTAAGVLMAAFLGGAACHLLLDGAAARAATEGQVERAEAFILVDDTGKELARLGVSEKGQPVLTVLDAKGKERVRVGALEEPAGFGLDARDADGHSRATFAYWADDVGGMRLFDAEGIKRIGLGFGPPGTGLSMQNSAGTNIIGIGVGPGAGGGDLSLKHPFDGHEIWRASAAAQAAPAAAQTAQPAAPAQE